MKTKALITIILLIFSNICTSQIIHVPADQPTIQAGINAAINGDIVMVDTGTYYENIDFLGKAITVASHYLIQKDSAFIYNTIIDGSQPSNPDVGSVVSFVSGEDTSSCLYGFSITGGTGTMTPYIFPVCGGGGINIVGSGCRIESNIITGNQCIIDETDGLASGGGIACGLAEADDYLIIENNTIYSNTTWSQGTSTSYEYGWGEGGGISIALSSNGIIKHNQIHSNQCKSNNSYSVGGAIRLTTNLDQSVIVIDSNEIYNNESISLNSNAFAGGISCSGANAIIKWNSIRNNKTEGLQSRGSGIYFDLIDTFFADVLNNMIIGNYCIANTSQCNGGGIGIYRSYELNIINNLILENAAKYGGGLHIKDSNPTIINNTITENIAEISGGGMYFDNTSSEAMVTNSILWNNNANEQPNEIYIPNPDLLEITYSDVANGWGGEGNIDEDPLFFGTGDHPFSLQDNSPCVNTGNPDTTGMSLPELDLAEKPRFFGGRIEMGAYENQNVITGMEYIFNQTNFELSIFPNPIKNRAIIELNILKIGSAVLSIKATSGKLHETIISEELTAGIHQFEWNAAGLPAGIYFLRLETNDNIATKKIILMD